ncbi:amidase [Acidisoma cladoniae]|uniref:amidase n=1 Tax=Acidisoma cladoniae TaxID=3040935 RepID=UPI00254DC0B5|nr:amidase [Acidisoma sp. PAMC 29798]
MTLTRISAIDLAARIAARDVSCVEVMTAFLDHIDAVNPVVNAIVSRVDRATLLAEAAMRDMTAPMGPLHGLPFAVKDLEETKGLRSTHGSPLFADHVPDADSIMVSRLRAAGAILIGKTNVPEFGFGSQTYNTVFGTTLNAYDQSRTAGGSSGGAAVALALGMLPLADGSDHGGSLRNPAAFNNVFGFRPSPQRIPEETLGDVFAAGMAVLGPMARSVADLAMLFSVQAGPDPRAPLSLPESGSAVSAPLDVSVAGRRIGWLGDLGGHLPMEPDILSLCESGLRVMEGLGAIVEPVAIGFPMEDLWQAWIDLRAWLIAASLGEIYADDRRDRLKPEAQWEVARGLALTGSDVSAALAVRTRWVRHLSGLFARYDYLVLPSAQVFPFAADTHWQAEVAGKPMDSYHRWMEVVVAATMSALPALNVPVGFNAQGLPMGMQLMAPFHADLACLQLGHAYDCATRWPDKRPPPLRAGR